MELSRKTDCLTPSHQQLCDRSGRCLFLSFLFFAICCIVLAPSSSSAVDKSDEEILEELLKRREEKLWQEAQTAINVGKDKEAALAFWRYWRKYPDSPKNEEALWQAANLYRELALVASEPDWEKVADLFRAFTLERPHSPHLANAYFQVGNAYYQMHFYREALTYFSLFGKRYPDHPFADKGRYLKARCLMKMGRVEKAREMYRALSNSTDPVFAQRGMAGIGHIFFLEDKFHDALATYLKILRKNPSFYVHDPQIVGNMGISYLRVGNDEEGRAKLLHYLNLSGLSDSRANVLFELAESYVQAGQDETARKFFARIIDEGKETDRLVTLSRFRLAQKKDQELPEKPDAQEAQKPPVAEDKPFLEVLDRHYSDPLSQDARLDLLKRHWARQEYDEAYTMAKSYLRYETTETGKKEVVDIMGQRLVLQAQELFKRKEYAKIYSLYQDEYQYLKSYQKGNLLFLVGRALEEMSLFQQAGVVYYRALALELTDLEKRDLYIHRAQTYLKANDLKSAQRLLKYLRKIYVADPFLGEICFLSGRLREMQGRSDDALRFYRIAVESPTLEEKKDQYATHYLTALFEQEEIDGNVDVLDTFRQEKWLTPAELQSWYGKLGDYYRQKDAFAEAKNAYQSALAAGMPEKNKTVPMLQVYLGDVVYQLGLTEQGLDYYRKALTGSNDLAVKMARERLDQVTIQKAMQESEAVLNN